jgi:DHA2 family multidrug resistance protein
LRLLLNRQFGSVVAMVIVVGMVIYGTSYAIPQFLSTIAGYNSLQSGEVVMLSGVPVMLMMPITPWLLRNVDIRISVGLGLSILALSAWLETGLTSASDSGDFVDSQLLRGLGTVFCMMFLNQAAIRSVPPEQAGDASGLYNSARNLGGSFALAGIAIIQDQRLWLHSRRLEESLSANSLDVQDYVAGQGSGALRSIEATIQLQALTMTYSDMFWIMSVGIMFVIPLVLFLRPLPKNAPMVTGH